MTSAISQGLSPPAGEDVEGVARRFYDAYSARAGVVACSQLAPETKSELERASGKPCNKAVIEENVPQVSSPREIRVFATEAQVKWDGETTFLARFQDGWKVMAAACKPEPSSRYDCMISGG